MRVFVTGATGFIGSAVVRELLDAGHQAVGLARSDQGAQALAAAGAEVYRGDLDDPGSLHEGAAASDGVIHLAYDHGFTDFAAAAAKDLAAVQVLGAALQGTGTGTGTDRPLVIASGTLMLTQLAPGVLGTEDILPDPASQAPRIASENAVTALSGVRGSVVRLAPTVHGRDDHGFVPRLIAIAREKGFSGYVGDGANRWPAVHRLDAARLFRLAAESAPAGARLHGAAEEGVPFRDIAEAIGRGLGVPAASVAAEDAAGHFGFLAGFVPADNPTSSERTRKLLDWHPTHPTLLADLAEDHYFPRG